MGKKKRILILGGRGFVGKGICNHLKDHLIITFDRHPGGKNHIQGDITSIKDLKKAMAGMDCIVNLVSLTPLKKPYQTSYETVNVKGVRNVLLACKELKIKQLVHMSALKADKDSSIEFLRTKGVGEKLVLNSRIKSTVFCPSIIFDKENELIKSISNTTFTFMFPNITTKVQPIYRHDVAKLFVLAIKGEIKEKKIEIGGPDIMTIFEMAKKIYYKQGYPCLPIPFSLFKIGIEMASWLNLFGISKDQIKSLSINNTTKSNLAEKYIKLTKFDVWLNRTLL